MSTEQTNTAGPLFITQNGTYDTAYEAHSVTWDENTEYEGSVALDETITLRYKKAEGLIVPDDVKYLASPAFSLTAAMPDGTEQSLPLSELDMVAGNGAFISNDLLYTVIWVKDAEETNAVFGTSLESNTVYITDFLWVLDADAMAGVAMTLTAPGTKLESISSVTADIVTEPNLQYKYITENGSHSPDEGYDGLSDVYVDVPVPDGYLKPSGSYHIGANGTFDIARYENVEVNIRNSGTQYIYENGTHNVDGYQYAQVQVDIPYGYVKPEGTLEITENGTYDVTNLKTITVRTPTPGALVKYRDGSIAKVSAEQKAVLECAGLAMADDVSVAVCGFAIDGKLYPAASGMTWAQYCGSEGYNVDGFRADGKWVYSSENMEQLLAAPHGHYTYPGSCGLYHSSHNITIPGEYIWTKLPVGMSMGTLPKTEYAFGESLDITGGTVNIHWQDGSSSEVPLSEVSVAGAWDPDTFFGTKEIRVYTAQAQYRVGAHTAFSVTVLPPAPFTIDGVEYPMPKIGTTWGQWLISEANTAGIVNRSTTVYSADQTKQLYCGSTAVKITDKITIGGVYIWTAVSGKSPVTAIAVQKPPELLEYSSGETLNTDGFRLTVTYANGSTSTLRTVDCIFSGFDSSKRYEGQEAYDEEQVITVYQGGFTDTFTITMHHLALPATTYPMTYTAMETLPKTEYKLGESLDLTGGTIAVRYQDGVIKYKDMAELSSTSSYALDVEGFKEITKPGKHMLLVEHTDNGIIGRTAYTITVTE